MNLHAARGRLRCLAVWLGVTALVAGAATVLVPDVRRPAPAAFDQLLARVAAWVILACAAWAWAATSAVVLEAARGVDTSGQVVRVPGVPAAVRRLVLSACGAAVVAGLTGPAFAADGPAATDLAHVLTHQGRSSADRAPTRSHHSDDTVVVRAGDSLWRIAAEDLPPTASDAQVDAAWRRIYAANRDAVGADPGFIRPGLKLILPEEERHD